MIYFAFNMSVQTFSYDKLLVFIEIYNKQLFAIITNPILMQIWHFYEFAI